MPQPTRPLFPTICVILTALFLCRTLIGQTTPDAGPPSLAESAAAADSDSATSDSAQDNETGAGNASPGDTDENEPSGTSATDVAAAANANAATSTSASDDAQYFEKIAYPLITLGIGIAIVLGLIIGLRVNAFIALITAAVVVSLMAPGDWSGKISRVAVAFGQQAGNIGIVIAMAAVIGKCMLDSGAADRIVRAFLNFLGEKRAPIALMGSGFVLSVPVFFDTVFYLLVPLARSLYRKTNRDFLKYVLAISAGGAITHTLVPPTPGPLLMASNLGFDVGVMMMVGGLVALPAAIGGLLCANVLNRLMPIPMRQVGNEPDPEPMKDSELPSLFMSLAPVVLPVLMISTNTVLTTIADGEHAALFRPGQVADWDGFRQAIQQQAATGPNTPGSRLLEVLDETTGRNAELAQSTAALLRDSQPLTDADRELVLNGLNTVVLPNKEFYNERAFLGTLLPPAAKSLLGKDRVRMKKVDAERMNRLLLEAGFTAQATGADAATGDGAAGAPLIQPHVWETPARQRANFSSLLGNANLALLLSAIIAMGVLLNKRKLSWRELGQSVEISLMSGGVIILITAGGGAFGAMLKAAGVGDAIKGLFQIDAGAANAGMLFLGLGFLIAVVLKVAQGSSTVAMITASAMLASIAQPELLGFHPVYLATAIGGGSLVGSWMNDSGFWIFAKMSGLTEMEALKSWTVVLFFLGVIAMLMTLLLANVLPMT